MKKIISLLFSFIFLFIGTRAFASVTWNNHSQGPDCPTINIATPNQGGPNGGSCWTGINVTASAGEKVEVKIYYHNTGNEIAQNTHIVLYGPTNASGQSSFYAKIISDQGNLTSNTVRVSYPSSQTINYDYTTWWTKHDPVNQPYTLSPTNFLYGQDGSEVFSSEGGLDIGSIENNWGDQGAVVVTFHVSNTQPQSCSIDNFSANPSTITSGDSSTLSWNTSDCTTVKLNNNTVALDGSQTVWPTTNTTYILKAYNSSGTLVDTATATVNVNTPSPVCSINSFTATPSSIVSGNSSTLNWSTSNCVSVNISNLGYNVPTSGSQQVWPTVTTNYVLTAHGSNGSTQNKSVTITVSQPSQMTGNIEANPMSCTISSGYSSCPTTLTWNTYNPVGVSAVTHDGATIATGNNNTMGKHVAVEYGSGTYYLYNSGTPLDQVTVSAHCASGTSWNGSKCAPNTVVSNCKINYFTATPSIINKGASSNLSWGTSDCEYTKISPIGLSQSTSYGTSGTLSVSPTQTTTYKLTAYGSNGSTTSRNVTVTVKNVVPTNVCEITQFYADPSSINNGESSTLVWNTTGCTTVSFDASEVVANGSKTVYPNHTTTYTLKASSGSNTAYNFVSRQATVYVNEPSNNDECSIVNFDASDTSIDEGDYSILEWDTENCSSVKISSVGNVDDDGTKKVYPTSDKTYVLTAYDEDGSTKTASVKIYVDEDNNNNDDSCQIDSFTASDTYVDSGDEVTLKWRTTGCDDEVYITNIGDVDEDGSEDVYPHRTTTYTIRARGNGDSDSDSIKIRVGSSDDYGYYDDVYNTDVVTTVATNISQTSAQLNGLLTGSNYGNTGTYFEYGSSVYLGSRTSSRTTGVNNSFSDYVSGLSPNTIYYFRAVSESSNGISYGAIEIFRTTGYTNTYVNTGTTRVIREVVDQGTTIIGAESPIVLRIENRYQMVGVGDTIDYVVFYKNISSSRLSNPMVQVYIPKGITLINTSAGTYSENDRILSVPLNDLYPDEEGVIYLEARVDSLDRNLAQMVTTAILIFTTPNGAQENVMAYVLNNPKVTNLLGASVFGSGLFLGMNLVGWLLLITFILLLILLVRNFYSHKETVVSTIHHQ